MRYIIGKERSQLSIFPVSLDSAVSKDNEVRTIDLFVNSLKDGRILERGEYSENIEKNRENMETYPA